MTDRTRPEVGAFDLTGFAAATVGSWCAFRDAFDTALQQVRDLDADQRASVLEGFGRLRPHTDVEPALRRLVEAAFRVITLSHGSPGVAEAALDRGGIASLVERSLSSERIGAWFPRSERSYPAVYEPPHITASDLPGAVDALLALPSA